MTWNYERINADGKLCSYYGMGQQWAYEERGVTHCMRINYFVAKPNGVQYYWITLDNKFIEKPMSAARLHYFLHKKGAQELYGGVPWRMPLLYKEVKAYFKYNCPDYCNICGNTGIKENGDICPCAKSMEYEIKEFNRERRLAALLKI